VISHDDKNLSKKGSSFSTLENYERVKPVVAPERKLKY
jgi:hypothetical protein